LSNHLPALILAAGLGTRLKPFTDKHPKALAPVHGQPLLAWTVRYLQAHGVRDVVVNVHHFADQIEAAIVAADGWGSRIQVSDERDAVLETGGGLKKAAPLFGDAAEVVVLNVDALTDLNLTALLAAHRAGSDTLATLAVMRRESSRQLLFDTDMTLCGWRHRGTGETRAPRAIADTAEYAFTGVQVVSRVFWEGLKREGKFSLVDAYLDAAPTGRIRGYDHTGDRFLDVGKPESLEAAAQLFADLI